MVVCQSWQKSNDACATCGGTDILPQENAARDADHHVAMCNDPSSATNGVCSKPGSRFSGSKSMESLGTRDAGWTREGKGGASVTSSLCRFLVFLATQGIRGWRQPGQSGERQRRAECGAYLQPADGEALPPPQSIRQI